MRFNKIFLVDSENLGIPSLSSYIHAIDNYYIVVFHNEDTNYFPRPNYHFVQCVTKNEKNSLDFILSSYLGYMLTEYGRDVDYYIVSNDKGYQPMIDHWNSLGYNIRDVKIKHPKSEIHSVNSNKSQIWEKCCKVYLSHIKSPDISAEHIIEQLTRISGVTQNSATMIYTQLVTKYGTAPKHVKTSQHTVKIVPDDIWQKCCNVYKSQELGSVTKEHMIDRLTKVKGVDYDAAIQLYDKLTQTYAV